MPSLRYARLASVVLCVCVVGIVVFAPLATEKAAADKREAQRKELARMSALALNHSLRYLHTTWWQAQDLSEETTAVATSPRSPRGWETTQTIRILRPPAGFGTTEGPIRGQAMAAYATAIALRTGAYNPQVVGVSRDVARRRVVEWTSGLAVSYQREQWGHGWESALWVYYLGFAAEQVWGDLPATTQELVHKDVAAEADGLLPLPPLYIQDASGTVLFPGDTKAEEDGWNGTLLLFAARTLPNESHAAEWEAHGRRYAISAWASPDQLGSDPRILGSNVNPNGSVANHNKAINPDYMLSDAEFVAKAFLIAAESHTSPPAESFSNFRRVWWGLTSAKFSAPPYQSPGGTIYRRSGDRSATPAMYYPVGVGWATHRSHNAALMDCEAFVFDIDPSAYAWGKAHLGYVLWQQGRHRDGRIFSKGESAYPLDEQLAAASEAEMVAQLRM